MTRQRPNDEASFSLFPFLAVLLCTLGSLILLLVVITHYARQRDMQRSQAAAEVHDDLEVKVSTTEWRNQQLAASRDQSAAQLAEGRAELSHLEDHARRVRDEIEKIEQELARLTTTQSPDTTNLAELRAKLADLEARIRSRTESLEKTLKDAQHKRPSYAIIPHTGPNQTRRRPLYIECLADRVVLQPEGIVLRESDFIGMLGPGNPLASALRAGREYLSRSRRVTGQPDPDGEPYPLLLVRPSGIGAYYAARDAMTSWGTEFGYEFVDEEWQLKYMPVDDGLAMAMNRAVEEARRRQIALALAAPRLLTAEERMVFTRGPVSAGGVGAFNVGGSGAAGSGSTTRGAEPKTADDRRGGGTSALGGAVAGGFDAIGDGAGPAGAGVPHSSAPASSADLAAIYGGVVGGPAGGGVGGTASRPGNDPNQTAAAMAAGRGPGGGNDRNGDPNALAGKTPGQASGTRGPDDQGKQLGDDTGTGQGEGRGKKPTSGSGKSKAGNASQGGSSSATGGTASNASSQSGSLSVPSALASNSAVQNFSAVHDDAQPPSQSLTIERGANWAVPPDARAPNLVLLTRPIHVDCYADQLVLRSERGDRASDQIVRLDADTTVAIDTLVAHVWKSVESWGIAGRNMAWRPILVMHVADSGRGRYAQLQTLFEGSGLEVREANPLLTTDSRAAAPSPRAQAGPVLVTP